MCVCGGVFSLFSLNFQNKDLSGRVFDLFLACMCPVLGITALQNLDCGLSSWFQKVFRYAGHLCRWQRAWGLGRMGPQTNYLSSPCLISSWLKRIIFPKMFYRLVKDITQTVQSLIIIQQTGTISSVFFFSWFFFHSWRFIVVFLLCFDTRSNVAKSYFKFSMLSGVSLTSWCFPHHNLS